MQSAISVRELSEFVHRSGDINHRLDERVDAQEGLTTQRSYQARIIASNSGYLTERVCRTEYTGHGVRLKVSGRADGVVLQPKAIVEEIKASRLSAQEVHERLGSMYLAQARLYAAILVETENLAKCEVQLTYVHPDTLQKQTFVDECSREELREFLEATCEAYTAFLGAILERVEERNKGAMAQRFPFEDVSEEQLRVARRAYVSVREKEDLMLEAPTGIGKTVATLYPTVKAMGQGLIDRVVFATAKTTGQRIAIDTMRALEVENEALTTITIVAKDRICFTPGATCAPEHCEYSRGHYDRLPKARKDLLSRKTIDRKDTELVARAHGVCPYALSLDVAPWVDVVVGDYSYVFDPMISLSSLRSRHFRKVTLLIDEAHRLGERVSDMLSVRLEESMLEKAISARANREVEALLLRLLHLLTSLAFEYLSDTEEAVVSVVPEEVFSVASDLQQALLEIDLASTGDVLFLCLNTVSRLIAAKERHDDASYAWFISRERESIVLSLRCLAPGNWIRKVATDFKSSVRFSGTLSPSEVFAESHGLEGPLERARIDPDPSRFGVMLIPDISTYWQDRRNTARALGDLVQTARESDASNWLVAFPSFEYMELAFRYLEEEQSVRCQKPSMSIEERSEFIDWLNGGSERVAFVVMGGIFTESVDFASDALAGVIVVGPAIPPTNLERELVRDMTELGYEIAYRQPALTRVVQAAGRVVRNNRDRGAMLLVDPRFTHREVQRYFPQHWVPRIVRSSELKRELSSFWNMA